MNISYRLTWTSVNGAVSYQVSSLSSVGVETVLGTTISTFYVATIDDAADSVFLVRPYDGSAYGSAITIVYNKPLTLAAIRDLVKIELKATANKWSDAEFNQYIQEAITDYSKYFPRQQEVEITLTDQAKAYSMPADCQGVSRVEYITTTSVSYFLKFRPYKSGETDRNYANHYDYRNGVVILDFTPETDSTLKVRYSGAYQIPPFDSVTVDIPRQDIELIILYACAKATVRIESQDANLQRWDDSSSGRRDDNPLIPSANRYFNAYRQKINDRKNKPRFFRRSRV